MYILAGIESWDFSMCQVSFTLVMQCQYAANIHKKIVTDGVFKIELANSIVLPEMHFSGAILHWKVKNNILDQAKVKLTSQLNSLFYSLLRTSYKVLSSTSSPVCFCPVMQRVKTSVN